MNPGMIKHAVVLPSEALTHDALDRAAPLISVVTVVLNDVEGLRRTHASLRRLDQDFEWIVVDGGSTDGTLDWLQSHDLPPGRVISEKDRGIYDAMNKGWRLSRGEWVYFLNAGDVILRGLAPLLAGEPTFDVVTGRVELEGADGRSLGRFHPALGAKRDDFRSSNCIAHQATLLRRDALERFGAYSLDYRIQGDFEYWVRLQQAGARFRFIDDVLAGFVYDGVSSRRSNFLRAEAERRSVLRSYGQLGAWRAAGWAVRTSLLFHLKTVALAVLPSGLLRRMRSGAKEAMQ